MKSDTELIKTFKVEKLDQKTIFVEIIDSEAEEAGSTRQAELICEAIVKIVNQDPSRNYSFLVDLTLAGTSSYISPKAREVYSNLSKVTNLDRAAVVGHNLMLEISVNLLMQATGRSQSFKWFTNKEEALVWLKKTNEK